MFPKDKKNKLPTAIWTLGFVSLFMDISSETIHGLLPVFLVTVLGASISSVGILEGLAEGTALILKVVSGPLSDWLGRRKPLVILGYAMGTFSKPFFALADSISFIYLARLFDRVGKGLRGAPRDAMVADLAPPELRGRAFGLRQSLDTVGAFIGPLLAAGLMWLSGNNFRLVFWIATVPGIIAVALLFFGVREPEIKDTSVRQQERLSFKDFKKFNKAFWWVAVAGSIFQLARFSEAFLILRAKEFGLGIEFSPFVLIIMNVVYSVTSYPVGRLSDFFKREHFLIAGLVVLLISDIVLGLGKNLLSIFIGIALWGLHLGFTQGTLSAMVTDHCPEILRGTAFGLFNLLSAVALLLASSIAGVLWDVFGGKMTFLFGAGFASLSLMAYFYASHFHIKPLQPSTEAK